MAESTGVAGYAPGVDGSYLHLAGGAARMVVRTGAVPAASIPYLVDANARLRTGKPRSTVACASR